MDEYWDVDTETTPRAVDVYMTKLQGKLANCEDFEIVSFYFYFSSRPYVSFVYQGR